MVEISRKSFREVCMDESKDVLVLFYSAAAQVRGRDWGLRCRVQGVQRVCGVLGVGCRVF